MTSPFQLEKPAYVRQAKTKVKPKVSKAPLLWGAFAALFVSVLIAWASGQIPGMPSPLQGASILPMGDKIYAAQLGGTTQTEARQLYRKALTDLQNGTYENALTTFKQLEGLYPGLQDFLWLHQAESYAGQGNEWATQKKLSSLIAQHPESSLKTLAKYRIGQSQVRGSEWEKAQKTFSQIRENSPQSPYAMGSLYYLGNIASHQEGRQEQAIPFLKEYLSQCHDCKFSGEAADLLVKLLSKPTVEDNTLVGLAEASTGKDLSKTIEHLSKSDLQKTWLAYGRTLIQAGKKPAGVQILTAHISNSKDLDEFREALDLILANTADKGALLKQLQTKQFTVGQDYLLWKLAEADSSQAQSAYQKIVYQYPNSDYAPESGWNLLWPLLASGNQAAYLSQAEQYLAKYPYARSAPKALFWTAKLLEKSSPVTAKTTYQNLMQQYPTNYYAFRAKGRLKALTEGKADPGWPTFASRRDYPTLQSDLGQLDLLPPATAFGMGGQRIRRAGQELMAIGAVDDVKLLLTETTGDVPPAVLSWAEQTAGDRSKGLRILREALDKQTKDAFLTSGKKTIQPVGTVDELKLLYPLYFNDLIMQSGQKNTLDPFLIQSLMREESYFNEFAISGSNARGLMQLLPSTAKEVANWEAVPGFQTSDLFVPAMNIRLGSRYLGFLHQQFNGNSMPSVGAYNGGPGAMKRWVQGSNCFQSDPDLFVEKIPYEQSRDYIKKVFASYWNYTRLYATPAI